MAEKILVSFEVDNAGAIRAVKQFRGEVDGIPASTEKASSGLSTLAKAAIAAGAAFAAAKIAQVMRDAVQASMEQERAFSALAQSMSTVGVAYRDVAAETQNLLSQIQETTRFSDDEAAAALESLIRITGDYEAALQLLVPTLDLAAGRHIDLDAAAQLAGRAATGMTATLSRYGIVLSETTREQIANADAMGKAEIVAGELNKRFGGAAAAELETYAGKVAKLGNYWNEFLEVLGDVVTKGGQATGAIESLIGVLQRMTEAAKLAGTGLIYIFNIDYASAFMASIEAIAIGFLELEKRATEAALGVIAAFASIPGPAGAAFRAIPLGKIIDDLKATDSALKVLRKELDKDFTSATAGAEEAARNFLLAVNGLTVAGAGTARQMDDTTEAIDEVAKSTEGAAKATKEWNDSMWQGPIYLESYITAGRSFTNILDDMSIGFQRAEDAGRSMAVETQDSFDVMQSSFSDLLGRGFMGELESFSDLWDSLWQDLAKSMLGILGDAFEQAIRGGGGLKDVWSSFKESVGQNRLAAGIGGAGMVYSGYQQGGTGGMIQGAMGGAMLGTAIMPGIGTVIGAVLGGVASFLGGEDEERYRVSFGTDTSSAYQTRLSGPGPAGEIRHAQMLGMISQYRASIMSMNSVIRIFEEGDLFDLIHDAPTFSFEGDASFDQIAALFSEQWLPDAVSQMFSHAINMGVQRLGVDQTTLDQLWEELFAITGPERIAALEVYISALVGTSRLLDDMDWQTITDESRMDSMTAFLRGMNDAVDAVRVQMLGMDDMSLIERAGQAQTIEQLITNARQAEIAMLRQIDQIQQGINDSINSQIEDIRYGGMSEGDRGAYLQEQIADIMRQLREGVSSPEAVQQLMADLQRYTGMYRQLMGEDFYTQSGYGGTEADWIVSILEEARGLSNDAFEAMRDQIRETNDALIAELERLIEALTHYGDTVATSNQQTPPEFDFDVGVNVNVQTSPYFDAYVESSVRRVLSEQFSGQGGPLN
jgi:hypothetical protein